MLLNPFAAQLLGLIKLMRPKQWVKNGFVLAPVLFRGYFLNINATSQALLALLLFCVASSATYVVNDIHDIEHDIRVRLSHKTPPYQANSPLRSPARYCILRYQIKIKTKPTWSFKFVALGKSDYDQTNTPQRALPTLCY